MNLRSIFLAGLVLALSVCVNAAKADSIANISGLDLSSLDVSSVDDGSDDSGLSGWFFNPDPPQPFPSEPDPSQPWTSPENIATLEYWLSLVAELGDDPSLLSQLYGLGMISSPNLATADVTLADLENSQETTGNVPEPLTLALIGGGLALLGLYANLGAIGASGAERKLGGSAEAPAPHACPALPVSK